jgi:uncharacterized protein
MRNTMKKIFVIVCIAFCLATTATAQTPELKFIADTLVVQADGSYEADPDLATMTFQIFAQDKNMKSAYSTATTSMQRIVDLAERSGLQKTDVFAGVLTVTPIYQGDRKKQARSYYVQGQLTLHIRDFSKIGVILDGSVEDGVADFRSLTYSLANEEEAKKQAVADAMRRAIGRASIALEQKGQKLGALRYMSLDVKQLVGVAALQPLEVEADTIEESRVFSFHKAAPPPPPPPPMANPEKITVTASVQCAFQIQ